MRARWVKIRRLSNPDEFVAQPAQDHQGGKLSRYILWNEKTHAASFKEVGEPLLLIGHFDTIEKAITHVMRKLL